MALKDFDASKIINFTYHDTSNRQPQTFTDGHSSGNHVTGDQNKIEQMFLEGDPLKTKQIASDLDREADIPTAQTFEANGYTVTGTRDLIVEKFLEGNPLKTKDSATVYDDTVGQKPDTAQTFNVDVTFA